MGTLTGCLKKAGALLPAEDRQFILLRAAELKKGGMSATEAAMQAVDERLAFVDGLLEGGDEAGAPAAPVAPAKEAGAAPAKIDDFGEKLLGARKDYATQLKDAMEVDVAAAPLSQSWPDPDYQKLLDGGADVRVVAMVRAMRDEVPTKPQSSWKLRGWVEKVTTLRKFAQDLMDGTQEYTKLRAEMEKQTLLRDKVLGRADLYEEVGHDKSLKGITFQKHLYSFYRGETNVTKWAIEQAAKATAMSNWPREIAVADTKQQALDQFKAKYATLDAGSKGKGKASFVIYRKRNDPGAFVGKKIGREYIDLHKAEDVKAAREYMQNNAAELEKKLERYKETPYERNAENAPRVGDDHRGGAPVTPEVFAETFGFRGVQFGNYVEQGRRQSDLNEAFDALMDMAAVLDIPPRAISLNGRLGLAFGARGKGGKNAPAAHYEPGNVVINLTKGGGPGSLAHEWFHSMDNYFAKESGEGGYMTDAARGDKLRAEMRNAFTAIKRAVQAGSLKTRSMELDKRKTKPYWSTPLEMSARSFESYIIAKLQDQNAANDYLANIIDEKVWQVSEEMRAEFFTGQKSPPTYPYPTVDELPALRAAFDDFFKTVQTKTDEAGNVAMFSRANANPTGITKNSATQIVDAIRERWANAPEVVVVDSMQDERVPLAVRNEDAKQRSQGASGEPEGFWFGGKAYIVASALNTPADVTRVLFHETLGHFGLRGTFGEGLTPILKQLAGLRRKEVEAKARQYGLDMKIEEQRMQAAEEVLAEMAQTRPEMGYVKRAIAAVRAWLRKNVPGFAGMKLTDADIIAQYILPARAFVERGPWREQAMAQPELAFSKAEQNVLDEISRMDDLFAIPKSGATTIEGVLKDLDPAIKVKTAPAVPGRTQYNLTLGDGSKATITVRPYNPYGESVYGFDLKEGEMAEMVVGRPGDNPDDVGPVDDVWIDVSDLKPGNPAGPLIYSAAANFAHNTGKIFIGDPAGLSDVALRRRTEQMLSSALKFGTTDHLAPHPRQVEGDPKLKVPSLKWEYGDSVGNIERMIDVTLKAIENEFPSVKLIGYDAASNKFFRTDTLKRFAGRGQLAGVVGRSIRDRRGEAGRDASTGQAGWKTVARHALFSHLREAQGVSAGSPDGRGLLDRLREYGARLGREPGAGGAYEAAERIFYSRSQGDGDGLSEDEGVRFSRTSPAGIQQTMADAIPQGVMDRLTDMTTSQRGFNRWWHRTVGTQLHKAKTNKQFAPVYYAVQDFMKDVSRMATIAADQAPDLLPQVDSLKDVKKLLPQMVNTKKRAAQIKEASDALFDGTLRYTRDEDGKAVVATADTDQGIVWTDAELRERGMGPESIALYRQSRAAIEQSLDNLLAADTYRMLTALRPEMLAKTPAEHTDLMDKIRRAAASDTPRTAVNNARVALQSQAQVQKDAIKRLKKAMEEDGGQSEDLKASMAKVTALANEIADVLEMVDAKVDRIQDLKAAGYAPLMRFGQYTVDVTDADGNRVHFGMYESQYAANRAGRKFSEEDLTVRQGVQSQRDFELLKGVSPETAMLFAEMLGVEKNEAMQSWLQSALAQQSALKRHIRRKGVEGFENDASRVVAAFITSNSRAASRALHGMRIQNSVENVRDGDVKDEAIALADYVNNPKEEAQAIRSLLFVNYIGGSIASAAVNLTQTLVQTFPYLSQYGGPVKSARRLGQAMKLAVGKIDDAELAAAVKRAEEDGVIKPQEVFQLQAEASRTMGSDIRVRAALAVWGSFFQAAEVFNRRVAFIAAYQTAKEQGIDNPRAFAENAVDESQGVFNKGNRPNWSRGPVGATLFTFKTFTIQYVEFLKRLPPKEKALALGVLIMLAGVRGLPFAEDAEDIVDTVAQQLGYNFTTKDQMDRFLVATFGKEFAGFLQNGASGTGLLPIDVSGRLGMADLLPATALLKPSETRKEDQVLEMFGVAGSFVRDALKGQVTPIAIRNLAKGIEMYDRGIYTDTRGRKVMDVDATDAAFKAIGLQPANVAAESRSVRAQYEKRALFTKMKGEITEQIALGMYEDNQDKVRKARARLDDWNEKNPEAKIILSSSSIRRRVVEMRKDRTERFIRSTPKELRAQTKEALQ